jgi:hypothetical protein
MQSTKPPAAATNRIMTAKAHTPALRIPRFLIAIPR